MEIGTVTDKNRLGRRRSAVFSDRCPTVSDRCPTVIEEMCCQYRLACWVVPKSLCLYFYYTFQTSTIVENFIWKSKWVLIYQPPCIRIRAPRRNVWLTFFNLAQTYNYFVLSIILLVKPIHSYQLINSPFGRGLSVSTLWNNVSIHLPLC